MSKDLNIKSLYGIENYNKKYVYMLEKIEKTLDSVDIQSEIFYKSSSQFKNSTLDISNLTPHDSLRHILASIDETRRALEKASINLRKEKIKINKLEKKINDSSDNFKISLLKLDIEEKQLDLRTAKNYVWGAIRKLSYLISQYESILETLGKEVVTEEDFEVNERRNHIMIAFNQSLCAARARGGMIDEGNHIYLSQLGINGSVAQAEVFALLQLEEEMLKNNQEPTQIMVMKWLESCADKYLERSNELTEYRGLKLIDEKSLLQIEG